MGKELLFINWRLNSKGTKHPTVVYAKEEGSQLKLITLQIHENTRGIRVITTR